MNNKFVRFIYITTTYIIIFFGIILLSSFYVCPIKKYLGIQCFGCGMTRAFFAVLGMDFKAAWELNPMIFPLFLVAVVFYLWFVIKGDKLLKYLKNYKNLGK